MHAQPNLGSWFSWLRAMLVISALTIGGVVLIRAVADDLADTGCGGG